MLYINIIYKHSIFFLNIYMHVFAFIHNEYTQYTLIYYVNTDFYFGFKIKF